MVTYYQYTFMFSKAVLALAVLLLVDISSRAQQALRPFPQHARYYKGTIKPNHITQQKQDRKTQEKKQQRKIRYIKPGCNPNEYYVWFERKGEKQCVSEGQGYGMIITALIAGADPSAKRTYDGLFNYYKAHRNNNQYMMF